MYFKALVEVTCYFTLKQKTDDLRYSLAFNHNSYSYPSYFPRTLAGLVPIWICPPAGALGTKTKPTVAHFSRNDLRVCSGLVVTDISIYRKRDRDARR